MVVLWGGLLLLSEKPLEVDSSHSLFVKNTSLSGLKLNLQASARPSTPTHLWSGRNPGMTQTQALWTTLIL